MNVNEIADEIYREISSSEDLTKGDIAFWICGNLGSLNIVLHKTFALATNQTEISPELSIEEKDIFKQIYKIFYYDYKTLQSLQSAESQFSEISSDGASISFSNQNSIAASYLSLKMDAQKKMKKLVNMYNSNKQNLPREVQILPVDALTLEPFEELETETVKVTTTSE